MSDQIHSILAAAAADVEKSGVPEDLRAAAFSASIAMRTGGITEPTTTFSTGATVTPTPNNQGDWHTRVASSFGVDPDDIGEAFDLVDGRMHVTIPPSRLSRQKAAAIKEVALLLCSARQAAGLDEDGFTNVGVVRDECRELGVLDSSNFAAEIGGLADYMSFRGSGRSRHLRVNRRGHEEAGRRLRDILGRD